MSEAWKPAASVDMLRLRATCYRKIREYFQEHGVLEVETPILSAAATTDPQIESFSTPYFGPGPRNGQTCYLITSPEYHMKRLLAAGSGPIYSLGRVFRQGEFGRLHNPEFTLLEWYRPGFSMDDLIGEVEFLARQLLPKHIAAQASEKLTYTEAFSRYLQIDIHTSTTDKLIRCAQAQGIEVAGMQADDRDGWLNLLMSHCIQPRLGREQLSFVTHYPASQAVLAELDSVDPRVALRFELFLEGIELANGFQELQVAAEQEQRFIADLAQRQREGKTLPPMDKCLLAAMLAGLPACSGVAVGVDRLLLVIANEENLGSVFTFPFDRA